MTEPQSALDQFRFRLQADWLPAFANDANRQYGVAGFQEKSIQLSEYDAANFLRAMDGGLVVDRGGGRYQCAQSRASEHLFWEGAKRTIPRRITLWLEPVISIATLARLHYDLGWPEMQLGLQTADFAFDVATYRDAYGRGLAIACEVKKTRLEVDHLISDLQHYCLDPASGPISSKPRQLNSYRKWLSLQEHQPPFLWIVGPDGYGSAFEMGHATGSISLNPISAEDLRYEKDP